MEKNLWNRCNGHQHIKSLHETAWRIVEAQHILSTRKLVDSALEQEILEELIDAVKPTFRVKEWHNLHPLLFTPFRYPPLRYGSRFGKPTEPSLWYGSLELTGAMAEKAYYQFAFLQASKANFGIIEVTLTAFSVDIKTASGIDLTTMPFTKHRHSISSPTHYEMSQLLGNDMRNAKIAAFLYHSARDSQQTNIALLTPKAFLNKQPNSDSFQTWECIATEKSIEFVRTSALEKNSVHFALESFLIDEKLPFPAN